MSDPSTVRPFENREHNALDVDKHRVRGVRGLCAILVPLVGMPRLGVEARARGSSPKGLDGEGIV